MRFLKKIFGIFFLAVLLSACAISSEFVERRGRDYFPGGSPDYAWGISQRKESFINVERAQSYSGLYSKERSWEKISPNSRASARIVGLNFYYPLSVRWELKDGRQFILENIDIKSIMNEYFRKHVIDLPWQRERRSKAKSGDYPPLLAHEIREDTVLIKWVIKTNRTPVEKRFTSTGAATDWDVVDEEFLIAVIKGRQASGINFDKWYEVK